MRAGERYRLLASAVRLPDGNYTLDVSPVAMKPTHPLGRLTEKQLGIVYTTDIYGTITAIIDEQTPIPSAAYHVAGSIGYLRLNLAS